MSVETILKIDHLTKSYKKGIGSKRVYGLNGLSLEVKKGEVLGIIGPNGAGKTTTFKLLLGLIRKDRGSIAFGESLTANSADPRIKIGFLPENAYFYSYLTVEESLDFYGRLFDLSGKERKRRVDVLISRVGLDHARGRQLRKFSRGMLQRVGIAQALFNDPELLILDEPMSGLDPIGRKEIRDIIISCGDAGKTVIFSSHILSDIELICDRVAMISGGELKNIGAVDTVFSQNAREYEIEYSGPALNLSHIAGENKFEIVKKGEKYLIKVSDEMLAFRTMDEVKTVGGKLIAFNPKQTGLETLYINNAVERKSAKNFSHSNEYIPGVGQG